VSELVPTDPLDLIGGSLIKVRVGNREYDAVSVARCHTCQHPARRLIEEKLVQNYSTRAVARMYSGTTIEFEDGRKEVMPELSPSSVYNHYSRGHMPLEQTTRRRLAEHRAAQIGSQYEELAEQYVDGVILAETVVHQTFERLANNELTPEIKDGLAAAKFLREVEDNTQAGLDNEAWSEAMQVYFETARHFLSANDWERFTAALSTNPILRSIARRMNGESPDADVLEAEYKEIS
jgi:hypothetical protein